MVLGKVFILAFAALGLFGELIAFEENSVINLASSSHIDVLGAEQIVEMRVHMDCPGCESKIRKALHKLDGVDNVDIDMFMQKVTVAGWADPKKKYSRLWPFPYNPEYHDFTHRYYNQYYRTPATAYAAEQANTVAYAAKQPNTSYSRQGNDYEHEQEQGHHDHHYSAYNYYEHGYNGHDHGYYPDPPYSTILGNRTRAFFSDDNAHACSIM
ncbi:hypothetical protein M9H77_26130 [Catharanthus roseus]|uniref:Uncharacterized protein n=1 Tax=Catharanthus roseus TaxID=4058 RepID=A0ACC0AA63_CATRO|nr:hypothetical protein M9H77_26130 [Catharanthus roseus]